MSSHPYQVEQQSTSRRGPSQQQSHSHMTHVQHLVVLFMWWSDILQPCNIPYWLYCACFCAGVANYLLSNKIRNRVEDTNHNVGNKRTKHVFILLVHTLMRSAGTALSSLIDSITRAWNTMKNGAAKKWTLVSIASLSAENCTCCWRARYFCSEMSALCRRSATCFCMLPTWMHTILSCMIGVCDSLACGRFWSRLTPLTVLPNVCDSLAARNWTDSQNLKPPNYSIKHQMNKQSKNV